MKYKLISADRYDDVIKHLREFFFKDEPLNKAAGLSSYNLDLERHSYRALVDNISIMAVNEENEIAGVLLNGILLSDDFENSQKKLDECTDEQFKIIYRLLYTVNERANMFEKFNVNKAFDLRILSVDSRFRGRGIANEMVKQSEQLARENQFKLLKADATGIFSQKIFKSNGYQPLIEQYYDKYTDENGKIILPVEAPHIKLQVVYKILN